MLCPSRPREELCWLGARWRALAGFGSSWGLFSSTFWACDAVRIARPAGAQICSAAARRRSAGAWVAWTGCTAALKLRSRLG
eukprot:8177080-Pyramimonas_sp.AAC.1